MHRFLALVAVMALFVSAAPTGTLGANDDGRVVVSVPYRGGEAQMRDLASRDIEILAFTKYGMDLYVTPSQLEFLRTRPYPVSSITVSGASATALPLDANLGLYHTYAEMDTLLTALAATYPTLAAKSVIGTSLEGRDIFMLKISDNVSTDEAEPEVLYIGNHHARELMSAEIPLRFAEYLLQNYGVDATVTSYVNDREIFFVPMLNPDGHVYVQNNHGGSSNSWWRKNRRVNANLTIGVDLNRNYDYFWGFDNVGSSPTASSSTYRGTAPFSEPETQVLRDFVNSRGFVAWLSYHSYGELLLYPWGYQAADTPEHAVFATWAEYMTADNDYLPGNPKNGAIYITNGDSDDWGYGETSSRGKIFAFTPEVNSSAQGGFGPSDALIVPTFNLLVNMNMELLKYADNPGRVLRPGACDLFAVQTPYGNDVQRLSWSPDTTSAPNEITRYQVESCNDPSLATDAAESLGPLWAYSGPITNVSSYTGQGYYFGNAHNLHSSITMDRPLCVEPGADTLRFRIQYNVETDWDYGYVEILTGSGWTTIPGNITTSTNPNGNNRGNGITGASSGFVQAIFPLGAYTGQTIIVRLSYVTDGAYLPPTNPGITVDDVSPVPTCASVSVLASNVTGTTFDVIPTSAGTYRYRVRGFDGDDHTSNWSNVRDYVVGTVSSAGGIPYRTYIAPNYPNPFNPSTSIPFVVGGRGGGAPTDVRVRVYSVRGELVATLVDEARAPGAYTAVWDGRGDGNRPAASGIYFVRLEVAGRRPLSRKIVLLK